MGIRWSDALLAGANGIADYSNAEQQKRQARLDRAEQLKAQMSLYQAKSDFAYRHKQYEETEEIYKALGSTKVESPLGQYILQSKMEPRLTPDEVISRIDSGHSLPKPERLKAPQFVIPDIDRRVATSPAQDWIRKFKGQDKQLPQPTSPRLQEFMNTELAKAQEKEAKRMEAKKAGDEAMSLGNKIPQTPTEEKENTLDAFRKKPKQELVFKAQKGSEGSSEGTIYDIFDKKTGELLRSTFSASGKSTSIPKQELVFKAQKGSEGSSEGTLYDIFDKKTGELLRSTFSASGKSTSIPKQELVFKAQQAAEGSSAGTLYDIFDKNTGELLRSTFSASGKSTIIRAPDLVYEEDGKKVIKERGFDTATGRSIASGGRFEVDNPQDPESPMRWVSDGGIKSFMAEENSGDGSMGSFHLVFPKKELEDMEEYLDDNANGFLSFIVGEDNSKVSRYKYQMAQSYMNIRQNSTLLTNEDSIEPEVVEDVKAYWKAKAYIQTFGKELIADMIRNGKLDRAIFEGEEAALDEVIEEILEASDGLSAFNVIQPTEIQGELREVGFNGGQTYTGLSQSSTFKF